MDNGRFYEPQFLKTWLELPELSDYLKSENDFLARYVEQGSVLLDIGCGTGRGLESVLAKVEKACGIDISEDMLTEAKKLLGQNGKVDLKRGNADNIPYANGTFDYVICIGNTFGNFEDPHRFLQEMIRVVKSRGAIVLGVYSQDALLTQLAIYKKLGLTVTHFDDEVVYTLEGLTSRRFSEKKLKKLAENNNLHSQLISLNDISYILILRKNTP